MSFNCNMIMSTLVTVDVILYSSEKNGSTVSKKAFVDIRLRPGIITPLMAVAVWCSLHLSASRPLRPNVTSFIKPEVHNIAQRHQRRTEPRPQGICTQNFALIGPAVREICSRTDRRTDGRVDHNTPHPYRGGVMNFCIHDWHYMDGITAR